MFNQLLLHALARNFLRPVIYQLLLFITLATVVWARNAPVDQPVRGTVLDEKGSPLVGVNIQIRGTSAAPPAIAGVPIELMFRTEAPCWYSATLAIKNRK
jgi:hypothetical protein